MEFKFIHTNYNVKDLDKSMAFYEEALGLKETRRIAPEDGRFVITEDGYAISLRRYGNSKG